MVTPVVWFEIAFIQPVEAVKISYSHDHKDCAFFAGINSIYLGFNGNPCGLV